MNRIDQLLLQLQDSTLPDTGDNPAAPDTESIWSEPFHDTWMAHESCDYRLRLARAQAAELAAAYPFVKPGELIVGNDRLSPIVTAASRPFGNCIRLDTGRAADLKRTHPEQTVKIDAILAYWTDWLARHPQRLGLTCHASLAYERILELGVDGLRRYVQQWRDRNVTSQPESAPWYDALLLMLQGVSGFIEAHARAAEDAADRAPSPQQAAELHHIAAICRHVAHSPPRSFHEAVQLFYLVFAICGHDSPGPVDRYLYPALKKDLDAGAIDLDSAQEIVDCLWIKFAEKTAYGATLGGQLRDGADAANELSFLCLDAIRRLRLLSPRTAVRWHRNISPQFFARAVDTAATGASYPAFVNDEAIIPAAVERGVEHRDAREYTFVGCGQTYPHGRGHGNYEDVVVNAAKAIELALRDGVDPDTGQRIGPTTGSPANFATYAAFEQAYRAQIDALIARQIHRVNERRAATRGHAFDFLRSLLTHSCVERGLDWHAGGADYSEGMVDLVGLTTVTDSLVAIQRGVYERRAVSLPQLVAILDSNWEDEEALRQFFLKRLPKFGNGAPEADDMAAAELDRLNRFVKSHRTAFGGPWGVDIIGWSGAVIFGERTSATPDGRRAGEPVADCAGPAQGRNIEGLTQTLQSALRLPHRHIHGPLALSLRFPKSMVADADSRAKLRAAIESYFLQGGQQLQISIASTAEMKDAQQHPEAHRSLIVRVGGFSARFVELDKKWQDDMIARAEMELA